jgi:hypothetical protein
VVTKSLWGRVLLAASTVLGAALALYALAAPYPSAG